MLIPWHTLRQTLATSVLWQFHIPYRGNGWNRGRLGCDDGQQEAQLVTEMQSAQVS